ncbi:MAG: hypothetical protein AB7K24_00805 [Gemmataceae bacterium]
MSWNESETLEMSRVATLEYLLLGDLRDLLEETPSDTTTYHWLVAVLDALLDTLPREFGLEEADGYLNEVLQSYPSWYRKVAHLQAEHQSLYGELRQLRRELQLLRRPGASGRRVRQALHRWMNRLIDHHRREQELVLSAMNLEVGAGD